jgi:Uracil-DNA glycosylase
MNDRSFARHLAQLHACRACPNVIGRPVTGAVEGAKILLLGQAPGPHEVEQRRPFAYTAGRRLFAWFAGLGVDEETFRASVHIAAVIRCFPGKGVNGGDRVPDAAEIANCARHLDTELALVGPGLVIAVGTLASQQLLDEATLSKVVGTSHRTSRAGRSFDVIVLPHPSGRSTWLNRPEHATMLERSLRLIREHSAFRETFG